MKFNIKKKYCFCLDSLNLKISDVSERSSADSQCVLKAKASNNHNVVCIYIYCVCVCTYLSNVFLTGPEILFLVFYCPSSLVDRELGSVVQDALRLRGMTIYAG